MTEPRTATASAGHPFIPTGASAPSCRSIVVTEVLSDQCGLVIASEARMRDFDVIVPSDCVAERNKAIMLQLKHIAFYTDRGRARLPSAGTEGRGNGK